MESKKPYTPSGASEPILADAAGHIPVLAAETLAALQPRAGETYVDLTAGRGGHACLAARSIGPSGRIVLFDVDDANLRYASARVTAEHAVEPLAVHGSFASVARELGRLGLAADLVLADLGFASTQVDDPARGLSFQREGPLDMRLDPSSGMTAADLVNGTDERELADIIARYGEEPLARKIAAKIAAARAGAPILSTMQLAEIVRDAYGARAHASRLHPATKTFQALRIAVNDELGALSALLDSIRTAAERVQQGQPSWLAPGARIAVIGFHSLEDRMVKQCFNELRRSGLGEEATDGAVVSSESESVANPRARSAKLRAIRVGRA